MQFPLLSGRLMQQLKESRTILSLTAGVSIALSVLHHWVNFWGLPWSTQVLLVLAAVPALSFLVWLLLTRIWEDCRRIRRRQWFLFLLPTLGIASIITWRTFSYPVVSHQLEIVPAMDSASNETKLLEIRAAYGNVVPLSEIANPGGWVLQDGTLIAQGPLYHPIRYSFTGPINEQVRITFLTSPRGGNVKVVLDGKTIEINLKGPEADQKRARLDTQYRWGMLNPLVVPIVISADWIAFTFLLMLVWVKQEINQIRKMFPEEEKPNSFRVHRNGLFVLLVLSFALHIIYFLSVPLYLGKDSPSYLQGAIYWIRYHNLDGVSSFRGPGTTFLFTPFIVLFRRNPWGLKILLHLLAMGCVPVSYRLGWQLGKRRWFAFAAGLLTTLNPDLYFYSSQALSDVPHFFFGLLFCTFLLSALEKLSIGWLIATMLVGSFSILLRSETFMALMLGAAFLLMKVLWEWKGQKSANGEPRRIPYKALTNLRPFGLAILIAAVPILAWSAHNDKVYGFFGISDYTGAVLWDGWVYFGESSRIHIADQSSSAVRTINAVYQPDSRKASDVPTSWTIYSALIQHGYTSEQAFSLLERAATDSIRRDIRLTWKLLVLKIRKGLEPQMAVPPLPGDQGRLRFAPIYSEYFDEERISPGLVYLQRMLEQELGKWYRYGYPIWVWICLGMLLLCLYRKPFFTWVPIGVITANNIFLPTVLGMSMWRYVLSGILLMQIFALAGLQSLLAFIPYCLQPLLRRSEDLK